LVFVKFRPNNHQLENWEARVNQAAFVILDTFVILDIDESFYGSQQ
jgi:hypothetical protein